MLPLILAALVCAFVYLLYRRGLAVTKCIAAVLFVFRPGRQSDRVSVNSCTGWVRHARRFRESRVYEFQLDCQLSEGEAEVLLLDSRKRELLRLNRDAAVGRAALKREERCYLRWEFKGATGKCELRW